MKSVQDYLETTVDLNAIREEVLSHRGIQTFMEENQLNDEKIDKNLTDLYRFVQEVNLCKGCTGLDVCKMDAKGYQPALKKRYGQIEVKYHPCTFLKKYQKEHKLLPKLRTLSSLDLSYDDFDQTPERVHVLQYILDFVQSDEFVRGLFLHGKPGVGKTRILTVTAKRLALQHDVLFVYYPDFVRDLKNSFKDHSVEDKVTDMKRVEILFLDDFGDEGLSSDWYRDEVLMPILQYRMEKRKPIFFGSNYGLEQLEAAFSNKIRNEVKVEKLLDRIRNLSKAFELTGKNYRN